VSTTTLEPFIDGSGKRVMVHPASPDCFEHNCCIHNPSQHPLSEAPLVWREAGAFDIKPSHMERVCEHGTGHPDPDGLAYLRRTGHEELAASLSVHGCDGCCSGHGPRDPDGPLAPGPRSRVSTLGSWSLRRRGPRSGD
jgi:hypothetical protein